jgi:hypothetical protein
MRFKQTKEAKDILLLSVFARLIPTEFDLTCLYSVSFPVT